MSHQQSLLVLHEKSSKYFFSQCINIDKVKLEADPLITIEQHVFPTNFIKLEETEFPNISQDEQERDPLEMELVDENFEEDDIKETKMNGIKYDHDDLEYEDEIEMNVDEGIEEIQNILKMEVPTEDEAEKIRVEIPPPIKIPIPVKLSTYNSDEGGVANLDDVIDYDRYKKKKPYSNLKPCLCTFCNTGFPNQHLYQIHLSEFHADKLPFPCKVCGKAFNSRTNQERHETIHDKRRFQGEPKFACDLCDKKYHLKASLDGHRKLAHFGYKKPKGKRRSVDPVREHHSVGVRNPTKPKKEPTVFKCPDCDLKFAMRCYLLKHMLRHNKEESPMYACEICKQPFTMKKSYHVHMKNIHSNTASSGPRPGRPKFMSKQPCPCTICGKDLQTPSRLARHMLIHTGEKPHECPECHQRFRLAQDLKIHRRICHPTDPNRHVNRFMCRVCGKAFPRVIELKAHRKGRLINHKDIPFVSEKEMWFGCGICGKPYYLKEGAIICTLLGHDPRTLHAAMFRFKCQECPNDEVFAFHSTRALRKHWEKEHQGKPFPNLYRAHSGVYSKEDRQVPLPNVSVPTILAKSISENGPPPEAVAAANEEGIPLYMEYGLMSDSELLSRGGTTAVNVDGMYSGRGRPRKTKPLMIKQEINLINTVNINDIVAVRHLLGYRSLQVKLIRLCESNESKRKLGFNGKTNSVNIDDTLGVKRLLNYKYVTVEVKRFQEM